AATGGWVRPAGGRTCRRRQHLGQQSRRPKRNRTAHTTSTDEEIPGNRNSADRSETTRRNLQNRRLQVRFLSHLSCETLSGMLYCLARRRTAMESEHLRGETPSLPCLWRSK